MSAIAMGSTEVGVVAVLRPLLDVPAVLAALQAQGKHVRHRVRRGSAASPAGRGVPDGLAELQAHGRTVGHSWRRIEQQSVADAGCTADPAWISEAGLGRQWAGRA